MDFKFPLEIDSAGRLLTVDGPDETRQRADITLSSHQGEWSLDITYGVPWRSLMTTKPVDPPTIKAAITQQLRRVPGLDSVEELDMVVDGSARTMTVTGLAIASGTTIILGSF